MFCVIMTDTQRSVKEHYRSVCFLEEIICLIHGKYIKHMTLEYSDSMERSSINSEDEDASSFPVCVYCTLSIFFDLHPVQSTYWQQILSYGYHSQYSCEKTARLEGNVQKYAGGRSMLAQR